MNEYTKNKTIMIIKIRDPNYARRLLITFVLRAVMVGGLGLPHIVLGAEWVIYLAIYAIMNSTIHAMIHTQDNNLTRLHLVSTMHINSQLRINQYNGE